MTRVLHWNFHGELHAVEGISVATSDNHDFFLILREKKEEEEKKNKEGKWKVESGKESDGL